MSPGMEVLTATASLALTSLASLGAAMPAVYENLGVRFLYPENWSITEEDDDGWPRSVTLQSQETGFWSLHVYPPNQELKPIVKELIAAIQAEFTDIEVLPAKETFGETPTTG